MAAVPISVNGVLRKMAQNGVLTSLNITIFLGTGSGISRFMDRSRRENRGDSDGGKCKGPCSSKALQCHTSFH